MAFDTGHLAQHREHVAPTRGPRANKPFLSPTRWPAYAHTHLLKQLGHHALEALNHQGVGGRGALAHHRRVGVARGHGQPANNTRTRLLRSVGEALAFTDPRRERAPRP